MTSNTERDSLFAEREPRAALESRASGSRTRPCVMTTALPVPCARSWPPFEHRALEDRQVVD